MAFRQQFETIASAANEEGQFDARSVADLLGWQVDDIARFLDRSPSSLYRNPAAPATQDQLGKLVGLYQDLVRILEPAGASALSAPAAAKVWLKTSIFALDGRSPKEKILEGDLRDVRQLVNEYASGIAF